MTLSKEQIEAVQARTERATLYEGDKEYHGFFLHGRDPAFAAVCYQALRAIELEYELAAMSAKNAALSQKVSELVTLLDRQLGTPCEQIRHQQEVEDLQRELAAQKAAHAKMAREIADQLDFACNHVTWSPIRLRRLADKIE